ncbi:MAG TPA: NAD-dependent malic enzyme [Armatimonadota bacterium]|nr:NAD-dependent malic enzyme [Armatimonadota bacterium]
MPLPSASNSLTVRIKYQNKVGNLAKLAQAIADAGGSVGSMDVVESDSKLMVRDIVIDCFDTKHQSKIIETIKGLQGVEVVSISDRTFEMHQGGKIEVTSKAPLVSRDDLSMAYTPGVARISTAVAEDPIKAFALTIRQNCVAVVSDGSAVLGLGDIGPLGAMPVMEGKAMLFKEFGKVDAFPICLSVNDPKGIIDAVKAIAPTFGGINLEDIAAPKCFEVEETLRAELDIPVFHDDQHGTAAVVLAALYNALKIVDKDISAIKVVVLGAGAAGVACSKALMGAGVRNVILCDRAGTIYKGRKEGMNPAKEWLAENTNPEGVKGTPQDALKGADLFLGVSGPGLLKGEDLKVMAKDAVLFTLSNPTPEIMPEEAAPYARIIATGRSDYPNQINNVLCFPGLFRGLLDCASRKVDQNMIIAASKAIADVIKPEELSEDYIIPSAFNTQVAPAVAKAVREVAQKAGYAREVPKVTGI